ncbi:MAG: SHD1 domain-containing protein [Pirellulales bacterium]
MRMFRRWSKLFVVLALASLLIVDFATACRREKRRRRLHLRRCVCVCPTTGAKAAPDAADETVPEPPPVADEAVPKPPAPKPPAPKPPAPKPPAPKPAEPKPKKPKKVVDEAPAAAAKGDEPSDSALAVAERTPSNVQDAVAVAKPELPAVVDESLHALPAAEPAAAGLARLPAADLPAPEAADSAAAPAEPRELAPPAESTQITLFDEVQQFAPLETVRTWTDNSGLYKVNGKLAVILDAKVRIMKENGRMTTVPFARLSRADLDFVQFHAEKQQKASGFGIKVVTN